MAVKILLAQSLNRSKGVWEEKTELSAHLILYLSGVLGLSWLTCDIPKFLVMPFKCQVMLPVMSRQHITAPAATDILICPIGATELAKSWFKSPLSEFITRPKS